jgi:uncharacterized LabA/DUF88 family protein
LPDTGKVALFVDFDNIRIGIRQHFSSPQRNAEIHPGKLMAKASKYGRVITAKAYADFTGHPKEFQDKLLFAAGIEPIHAPSKISGGRRQSSADMHMVIDMFLEAIDHEDTDTFVLMTGDADFVRMVATLRRRFGRKVIISGVQSTSTSLDLMNAADARDPITRQDVDLTGELGPMTRPLVTRADLEAKAEAAAAEAQPQKGIGGIFGGLFRRKAPQGATPQAGRPAAAPAVPVAPPTPLAPRRMRASEVRPGSGSSRGGSGTRAQGAGTARTESASTRSGAAAPRAIGRPTRGRTAAAEELPAVGPGTEPDEVERNIIREIYLMPPGRMGYTTIKTIEETLRSKAGQMGATRKEIPTRLQRLDEMGIFKRESRPRGTGEVETGELVTDHAAVKAVTEGLERPAAKEPRPLRAPRRERGTRLVPAESAEATPGEVEESTPTAAPEQPAATEAEEQAAPPAEVAAPGPKPEPATVTDAPAEPFRWVTKAETPAEPGALAEAEPAAATAEKPAAKARAPRAKAATRKAATARKPSTRAPRKKEPKAETPAPADEADAAEVPQQEPTPG